MFQATPRATTPTRYKYKMNGDDFKYEDVIRAPAHSTYVPQNTNYAQQNSAHYNNRQNMGDSVYTTPTGYPDSESGYSLESRYKFCCSLRFRFGRKFRIILDPWLSKYKGSPTLKINHNYLNSQKF